MTDRLDAIKTTWNVPAKQPRPPAAGRDDVVWLVGEVERLREALADASETRRALADALAWIEDYKADHRAVVEGQCAPDERHCSCVPHLRRALAEMHEALADIARGDYSDPLCQRTPEQRAREALASKP